MFKFHYKIKECAITAICIGAGILLGLLLPPIGWMIGCALGLIGIGIYLLKHYC